MRQVINGVALGQTVRRLGLFVLLLSPVAQAEPVWQTMKSLLDQGEAGEAFLRGSKVEEEKEGDPNFDYYYGMAAIDAGEVGRGVFALERVLYQRPNMLSAQLELARGYFLLKQYDQAKRLFSRVLIATPPQNVRDKINIFLAVIEKREASEQARLITYFEGVSGYDSNTNFAPDNASFFSPTLGEGQLDESGTSKSGGFTDLLGGLSYYKPYDETRTQFFRIDLADHNVWWTGGLDTFAYTAQMGVISKMSEDLATTGQFIYQGYDLAGEDYRQLIGLAANASYTLNPQRSIQFGISILEFDYADFDNRDAVEYNVSAAMNQQVSFLYPALWNAGIQIGMSDPRLDSFSTRAQTEKEFWRLSLSQRVPISDSVGLTVSASYMDSEYSGEDVIFVVTREDKLLDIKVQLDWRWNVKWRVRFETGYKEQDSNIEIYTFDRAHAQLGVRYEYY